VSNNCASSKMKTVVIIGASGFIGEHLLSSLSKSTDIEVRVLLHHNSPRNYDNINFIEGDLLEPDSLDGLFVKNCTVINLAYLAQHNIEAMTNLATACAKNQVRRLIHCSTAVVVGEVQMDWASESTLCRPTTEYEHTKLRIENVLLEMADKKFEVLILRPTAVFGPGGENLLRLANSLLTKSLWINYIKSCVFSRRNMNLVCVENVCAALVFLLDVENIDREVFIISDDDSPINNYRDIEVQLSVNFGKSYPVPRVFFPKVFLAALLRLVGKPNVNPSLKYSDQKLAALGYKKPQRLDVAIDAFSEWYKNSHIK